MSGMGKFNSDDCCIYYCGQEYLRRYGVAIIVNTGVQNAIHSAYFILVFANLFRPVMHDKVVAKDL